MPVAIAPFQRRQERQEAPKESAIDSLLKGLQIAGSAMGLYTNLQQAQAYKQQQETGKFELGEKQAASKAAKQQAEMESAGRMTEGQYQKVLEGGKFIPVEAPKLGEPESPSVLKRFVVGDKGERPVFLRQIKPFEMETRQSALESAAASKAEAASVVEAKRAEAGAAKAAQKLSEKSLKSVSELRKEYAANPLTKDTQNIAASWERVQGGFSEPSAAGDLNLIFGYMKMLDPGSTVREGEFANAQNAAGVPERARAAYNKAISGQRLTEETRKDFYNQSKNIVRGQFKRQESIDNEYKRIIKTNKWDENQMIFVPRPSGFEPGPVKKGMRAADLESL